MDIYFSSLCRIGSHLSESLDDLIRHGADAVEVMLDGSAWDDFESRGQELADVLASKHLTYSVHTPVWDINLTSENSRARYAALETYRDSIAFAAHIGAKHVVLHPGFCGTFVFDRNAAREHAARAVEELCKFNSDYGMLLLVENVGNLATSIFSQEGYIHFIEQFNGNIGSLLDVGHASLCGWNLPETILRLKKYLYAVHLHDNNGDSDTHLPIGDGNIPWSSVFNALRKCRPNLRLILEYDIGTPLMRLQAGKEILLQAFPESDHPPFYNMAHSAPHVMQVQNLINR